MKPIIILPPKAMSDENIKLLRENDLCVVVAEDPALVKFLDPIPAMSQRTKIEDAAIGLSRKILNPGFWIHESSRTDIAKTYVDILLKGTPLSAEPTQEEQEQLYFNAAKREELSRLAKAEAKAEREAQKKNMKGALPKP